MFSQKVYDVCQATVTVTSELAKDPTQAPGKIAKKLYGHDIAGTDEHRGFDEPGRATEEDLNRARECGHWGKSTPSELFLRIYHDVLRTLEHDPLIGMTSPPLMGSCGTVPLTIISALPDICRHMGNCIARAEKEVFLATNYWKFSEASTIITNGLKELSRRSGVAGRRPVVKVMYDRGSPKQFVTNHIPVPENTYVGDAIKLPPAHEVPNIDLEVVNFHRPIFGTFHCKYMVVDRKLAVLSSNNIQDNANCEMMVHFEGPIVDSFYDMSLQSWYTEFKPPLPCLNESAVNAGFPSFEQQSWRSMYDDQGSLRDLAMQEFPHQEHPHPTEGGLEQPQDLDAETETQQRVLSQVVQVGSSIDLSENTGDDPHFDADIPGEVLRSQSVLRPRNGETRMQAVTRHLNYTFQHETKASAPECDSGDEMIPLIPLPAHEPVPMAMVCRKPWGAMNHACVHTPQNEAWLSALRNATRKVFIQSPDVNAEPLFPAIQAACRRGVDVYYYFCLGYNDAGELLPHQGGTNEMFSHKLHTTLTEDELAHLHVFNYVAKDQTRPIHDKFKKRSCHVKLMIVDGHIGIQGNGNQDTQSWYHSQEVNVMIDSQKICAAWEEGIRRNQNTHLYGAVSKEDGCWHDHDGKMAEGAIGADPGRFSWAKGVVGAVQRVRGKGGF